MTMPTKEEIRADFEEYISKLSDEHRAGALAAKTKAHEAGLQRLQDYLWKFCQVFVNRQQPVRTFKATLLATSCFNPVLQVKV